jgi:pilus assembly protein FimV
MKRPLQISLAIALACAAADAFALGLGPVAVQSGLNQPLVAEIPIIQSSAKEADGLIVQLATPEDFERVGLDRARISIPIQFEVTHDKAGQPVVRVTTRTPVTEPFLDFLIEANWPKGRLLREYTVLLDPPVMAPATGVVTAAARPPASTRSETLAPSKPAARKTTTATGTTTTQPARHATASAAAGQYGPVASGETLSAIARSTRADSTVDLDRMMLAMLEANPSAFFDNNINNLKTGAILRIPSADEIAAVGSAAQAAAQVRAQVEAWRGASRTASPTLVADTGASTRSHAAASPPQASSSERLELVPPKVDDDSLAMADRPGSGTAASGSAELRAELARTRETLDSQKQTAADLKSRVSDLESLKAKNDRLLGLKDSQIADLEAQLKALREQKAQAQKAPASTTASPATAAPPLSKNDIWGDTEQAGSPAKPTAATPAGTTPATAPPATVPTPAGSTPPAATDSNAATPAAAAPSAGMAPAAGPPATGPETTAPTPAVVPARKSTPAEVTPLKPTAATTVNRGTAPALPWYSAGWVRIAAIVVAVVLILGLLGLRKRSARPDTARGSIAGAFGDSPLGHAAAASAGDGDSDDDDEAEVAQLRDQIRQSPQDLGLRLELLSILYAHRDVDGFEAAAQEMAAHVDNPEEPEWQQAKIMGEELAPGNLLFSSTDAPVVPPLASDPDATPTGQDGSGDTHLFSFDDTFGAAAAAAAAADQATHDALHAADAHLDGPADSTGTGFDAGATEHPDAPTPAESHADAMADSDAADADFPEPVVATTPPAGANTSFNLDLGGAHPPPALPHDDDVAAALPPLDFDGGTMQLPEAEPDEDDTFGAAPGQSFLAGEDAIGTKLDLARAYLDMGDPEGARSMLEEVLSEGNPAQQDDARKLIAEIG